MNIAIIGGGFTGLTAAYELVKKGHQVTVFEKEKTLGGLAHGFKKKGWDWHLESAYHHLFTNDHAILDLIKELGLHDQLILTRPVTANYVSSSVRPGSFSVIPAQAGIQPPNMDSRFHGNDFINSKPGFDSPDGAHIIPFDSPIHLLTYPGLSLLDKLRTGVLVALTKLYPAPLSRTKWSWVNPFWQPLEWITAKKLFTTIGGHAAWRLLWEPLMIGKFGKYAESIASSWLCARIKKRTQKLYYIEGGFHTLVSALEKAIKLHGGKILTGIMVNKIDKNHSLASLSLPSGSFSIHSPRFSSGEAGHSSFDRVLLTIPTHIATKLIPHSSFSIHHSALSIPHLHAQTLILETKNPILAPQPQKASPFKANPGVYWLNIMDRAFPFLAVVAHTNMIDKKYYSGHHITYFGNYLPSGHPYLSMTKQQLLKKFLPYIKRINPSFHSSFIIHHSSFIGYFAQPVHELHYSRRAPKLQTAIPGIYLANMDSIYPWDRGTNYAVELGIRAANKLSEKGEGK